MALDLSAAIAIGKPELVSELIGSRVVNVGFHQSDLDAEAYEMIAKAAIDAAHEGPRAQS